jgi:hypothetical protein
MAAEGHFEYAIDLFLDGLKLDPDNTPARTALRDTGLRMKASGGKAMGMLKQVQLRKPTGNAVMDLFNTEKLLAYDPGNIHWMVAAAQHANAAKLPEATAFYIRMAEEANQGNSKR